MINTSHVFSNIPVGWTLCHQSNQNYLNNCFTSLKWQMGALIFSWDPKGGHMKTWNLTVVPDRKYTI